MIVVDACAVVDALVGGPEADHLRARLDREDLNAPTLLDHEVVSGLRGLVLGARLSRPRALDALNDFADLPMRRWESGHELRCRAFVLRDNLSAYDAAYVALAEALECPLVTQDSRLARAAGHSAVVEVF